MVIFLFCERVEGMIAKKGAIAKMGAINKIMCFHSKTVLLVLDIFFLSNLILSKLYLNATIINTQKFHKMKFDIKYFNIFCLKSDLFKFTFLRMMKFQNLDLCFYGQLLSLFYLYFHNFNS